MIVKKGCLAVPLWEEFYSTLLAYAITAGAAGAVMGALVVIFRVWRPLRLPLQRFRKGHWSGLEVVWAFVLFVFVPSFAVGLLESLGFYQTTLFDKPPSSPRMALWASPLATLLTLALLCWFFFIKSGTRPSHLGLTRARWLQNSSLGYLSFLILTPLVLGLFFVILLLMRAVLDEMPETHVLERLSKEISTSVEWLLFFFWAIVSAPLLEELIFRGVLQGWLRRASLLGHVVFVLVTLAWVVFIFLLSLFPLADQTVKDANVGALIFAIVMATGYLFAVYRIWAPIIRERRRHVFTNKRPDVPGANKIEQAGLAETTSSSPPVPIEDLLAARQRWQQWEQKNGVLSIFGSAMMFAAFHEVWPTPIPLFILGIGLGFLAFRTQSLLPSIVLHALFNAVASLALFLN
jgi:membrane protease YdiL (CAAX protease family)